MFNNLFVQCKKTANVHLTMDAVYLAKDLGRGISAGLDSSEHESAAMQRGTRLEQGTCSRGVRCQLTLGV